MQPGKEGTRSSGSKRGRWSRAELDVLRESYGLRDTAALARQLMRPIAGVMRVAQRLFPREAKSGPWTASEVLGLRRYLGATTPETIARILGRSVEDVQQQIVDLGRIRNERAWTREETAQFKRIYGHRTDEGLALLFGRSVDEVRRLSREHGLSKDKAFVSRLHGVGATPMPQWKPEELEILTRSYASLSNLEIARRLGRSVKSVTSKAHELRLRKSSERLHRMGSENVNARWAIRRGDEHPDPGQDVPLPGRRTGLVPGEQTAQRDDPLGRS